MTSRATIRQLTEARLLVLSTSASGKITVHRVVHLADFYDAAELHEALGDTLDRPGYSITSSLPANLTDRDGLPTPFFWVLRDHFDQEETNANAARAKAARAKAEARKTTTRLPQALREIHRLRKAGLALTLNRVAAIAKALGLSESQHTALLGISDALTKRHGERSKLALVFARAHQVPQQATVLVARAFNLDAASGAHLNRSAAL